MATRLTTILVVVIVGATFIAGLIVGAQRDDASGPVDLIILNGNVYSGAGASLQEAVAVRGNQILRVGTNRDIKRLRRAQTVVVDAHGAAVVPGFNDAHLRLADGALALDQVDLSDAETPAEVAAAIQTYAETHPSGSWILGRAADPAVLALGIPARRLLDEAVADRPVFLTSDDRKIAWTNSKALDAAGVTGRTRTSPRSAIVRDSRTGEPTGVLKSSAVSLVAHAVPEPTRDEKLAALREAIDEAHRLGVTSVQTVSAGDDELELLSAMRKGENLPLRVYGSIEVSPEVSARAVEELDALRKMYPDDPLIKVGGVELVCPGACAPAGLERAVMLLDKHGWQITVRAQDEGDVSAALDAFEQAAVSNPAPTRGRRHRLDTLNAVGLEDLPRIARAGLIVEASDEHEPAASTGIAGTPAADAVDQTAALDARPVWNAISEAGVRVLFGSEWPTASLDPLAELDRAVDDGRDRTVDGTQVASQLPLRAAIDASTSQAAYGSFDEQRKGRLAPGMLADIVILSSNIFETNQNSLKDAAVDVTIFDGKIVYQRIPPETAN